MPLLSELGEFKASFANIGGQKANLEAKKIPINDLKLPDTEAQPMPEMADTAGGANIAGGADTSGDDIDDFGFSNFINAQPGDLSVPDIDDHLADENAPQSETGSKASPDTEDLYFPDELLSDLSDGLEPVPPSDLSESDNVSGLENLDNLENFSFPADADADGSESANADIPPEEALDLSVFDDLGGSGDLGLPDEPAPAADSETPDLNALDDFSDLSLPDEPAQAADSETPDLGGLDASGDLGLPDEPAQAADSEMPDLGDASGLDALGLSDEPATATDGETPDLDVLDDFSDLSLPDELAQTADSETPDLGGLDASGDLGLPDEPAQSANGETPDLGEEASGLDDFGDLSLPDEPAQSADGETPDLGEEAGGLDDFGDLSLPDELAQAADGETPDLGDAAGGLDDFGDLSLPDEPAQSADGETPDLGDAASGLDDFGDLGLPDEPAADGETSDLGGMDDFGDLGLPDEPAADGETSDLGGMGDFGDLGLPDEPAADGETSDLGGLDDFGDLGLPDEPAADGGTPDLGGMDDFGDLGLPDEPAADGGTSDLGGLDDFGDLGLSDEPAADAGTSDLGGLDDFGDLGLPDEPAADAGTSDLGDLDDFGDLGIPDAPAADDGTSEFNDFDDLDLPDAPVSASDDDMPEIGELDLPEGSGLTGDGENFKLDDLDDFGIPEEGATDNESLGIDLGDLDTQVSLDDLVDTASGDAFEDFDPASGVGGENEIGEAGAGNLDSMDSMDDFFPDLDALGGSQVEKKAPEPKADKAAVKRDRKAEIPISDDVNDIELNDRELAYLQETLAGYPLNLRIACEEIIAEKDARPEQIARLLRNLIRGAPAKETAQLASEILDRTIVVPKGFEKSSGAALEAEKSTFTYIFVHNFLPMLRLVTLIALVAASLFYLTYKFVYIPVKAESIYKMGYERIPEGEYQRANERFNEAFALHRKKVWFFRYADAFINERQFMYAEQKYEDLLRYYPRDKLGVLKYAELETKYLRNYAKADHLLRTLILDFNPDDFEALLALGDNNLAWAEIDPSKYEDARFAYARLLDKYGELPFIKERMLKYFIRTDNLREVLILWQWFNADTKKRPLGTETLAELGGYFLDKQLEEVRGVPNEYVGLIEDVRDILLRAVRQDPTLPEPHYHLARYYKNLGNSHEERVTLEIAIRSFDNAKEETLRRLNYRIDTYQRYADNLIDSREFLNAEEQLKKGINLFDDAISRRLLTRSPQYGRLYAGLGDLEYFVKTGDMEAALRYYNIAQQNGWSPPEMKYRMGAAHYQLGNWQSALENFFTASTNLPLNRRVLFALGNAALRRGDNFAAQGYYTRLLTILESQRARLPMLLPNDRPEYVDLAERLMMARNNAGVANERLAAQTGNRMYHNRAMSLYAEAERAWDSLTRDPTSMVRSPSTSLPYLNMRNILYPRNNYEPQMYTRIDREPTASRWEQLAPPFKD